MELKHGHCGRRWSLIARINRTFMELKPKITNHKQPFEISINRTFMELKQLDYDLRVDCCYRINRTFMELKQRYGQDFQTLPLVLIEPLWN